MPAIIKSLKNDNPKEVAERPVVNIDRLDGTKFEFEDGSWLLLRASGTEPVVRVMVEAADEDQARTLADRLVGVVKAELSL